MWHVLGILVQSMVLLIGYEMILTPGLMKTNEVSFEGPGIVNKLVVLDTAEGLESLDNETAWGVWEGEGQLQDFFSGTHQHPLGLGIHPDNVFLKTNSNYFFGKNPSPLTDDGPWISFTGKVNFSKEIYNLNKNNSYGKKIFLVHLDDIILNEKVDKKNMSMIKEEAIKLFEADNKTSFLLLDHSNKKLVFWGHGAGKGPKDQIRQEDVAPLIAGLLGLGVPTDSRGSVPTFYLNTSEENVAAMLSQNGLQLARMCLATSNYFHKGFFFKQFTRLSLSHCAFDDYKTSLTNLKQQEDYENMKTLSNEIIFNSTMCISQFQTFYKIVLAVLGYLSVIPWCLILLALAKTGTDYAPQWYYLSGVLHLTFAVLGLATTYIVLYTEWPYYFIFYFTFPVLLWWIAILLHKKWTQYLRQYNIFVLFALFLIIMVSVELIYWTWKYDYLVTVFLLPYCLYLAFMRGHRVPYYITLLWIGSTPILLASYHVPQPYSQIGISLSSGLWFLIGLFVVYYTRKDYFALTTAISLVVLLLLSAFIVNIFYLVDDSFPLDAVRAISWWLLLVPLLAYFGANVLPTRILLLALASGVPYLLLSISYEPLFFLLYCFNLYAWLELEISGRYYFDQGVAGGLCIYFQCFLGSSISIIGPNSKVFLHSEEGIVSSGLLHYKTFLPVLLASCFSATLFSRQKSSVQNPQLVALVLAAHTSIRQLVGVLFGDICLDVILNTFAFTLKLVIAFVLTPFILRKTDAQENNKEEKSSISFT